VVSNPKPTGVDFEMRDAHVAILTEIEKQIAALDQREMAAASWRTTPPL
jgi:hypothetical protein